MGDREFETSRLPVKPDIDELIYGSYWAGPSDR